MKILFKEWLYLHESLWITPHDIEGINEASAFVYTKSRKLYTASTHEEICGRYYEELLKEYPKLGGCEDNNWAFDFALTGRYAPLTAERAERMDVEHMVSKDTFKNLVGKVIVTFWNNDKSSNTKLLFDELLVPCLEELKKTKEVFKRKIINDKKSLVTNDDIIVSIYNDEPRPIDFYLGGKQISSSEIDEDERKIGMEKMAFHRKRWADGRPLTPEELEKLKKKYGFGPPSGPPQKTKNSPSNPIEVSFNELMKKIIESKIFNFNNIEKFANDEYSKRSYLFVKSQDLSNDKLYKNKNIEEIIQTLKKEMNDQHPALNKEEKNNYQSAIKAVDGDGGFSAIGITGTTSFKIAHLYPDLYKKLENYDLGRINSFSFIVINPSNKNTSSFLTMIDRLKNVEGLQGLRGHTSLGGKKDIIIIYGPYGNEFLIL